MLSGRIDLQSRELHLTTRSHGHGTNQLVLENNPFLQSITLRSDDVTHVLTFESTESSIATVEDIDLHSSRTCDERVATLISKFDFLGCAFFALRLDGSPGKDPEISIRASAYYPVPLYLLMSRDCVDIDWDIVRLLMTHRCTLDVDYAKAIHAGTVPYGSSTIAAEIKMLPERSTAIINKTGVRVHAAPDAWLPARRSLKPGCEASALLSERLSSFVMDRFRISSSIAVEVSGGVDSALLVALMKHRSLKPRSLGAVISESQPNGPQTYRIGRIEERLQHEILRVCAWSFLDQTCRSVAAQYQPDAYGEYCYGAFGRLWDDFVSAGCVAVVGGYGGDEILLPSESMLTVDETVGQYSERRVNFPAAVPIVSPSALLACANHAPSLLRRGLWPIRPYCDPRLARFCYTLPAASGRDKRVFKDALASMSLADLFHDGYLKESLSDLIRAATISEGRRSEINAAPGESTSADKVRPERIWLEEIAEKLLGLSRTGLEKHLKEGQLS
ncbi:hypothetical protein [Caballeronia sp. NCTM1]|uniref:hypothetical protein n=1 Tax=Caballeronia sp. NCTM1 TaxID=2921753 RepID=UPI0020290539|nr:hypothetical protein [Caballeronia sp. NCTM1]